MNFVLIFCNSTASRLIYAYSHYNMCAGGGCMYQISNEKFGLFANYAQTECQFRYCGTAIPFLTVRSTAR